ncbi:hypothetical protein N566_00040 [Streptomycetaceae bacterium MP113-05]|nr:hypothetical protein N566_00040 [Streptomycetaceae bacterium MP113-05]
MQPYESSSDRSAYPVHSHLPALRHPQRFSGAPGTSPSPVYSAYQRSPTPIYDALYAEYQRLFRALPGDRSGEEELRFERFDGVRRIGTGAWAEPPRRHARAALPAALPPAPRDGPRYGL